MRTSRAFAVIISENDGINPELNTDVVGWHSVGTGSAPQNVIASLTTDALDKVGLKVTDVDYYSEMQNPDITKPAGAGDVPTANLKMIGALAVRRGDIERKSSMRSLTSTVCPDMHRHRDISPQAFPLWDMRVMASSAARLTAS